MQIYQPLFTLYIREALKIAVKVLQLFLLNSHAPNWGALEGTFKVIISMTNLMYEF